MASQPALTATATPRLGKPDSGNVHMALFLFLFVDCALSLANIVYPTWMPTVLSLLIMLVFFGLIVTALVRQHRSDMPSPLRNVVWGCFAYGCFLAGVVYIFEVIHQMELQTGGGVPSSATMQVQQVVTLTANIVSIICDLLLGTLGLMFLQRYLRRNRGAQLPASGATSETASGAVVQVTEEADEDARHTV